MLESTDKDGNTINSEHIICRGIPASCIQYKANQDKITVLDIYKSPYKGDVIEFDLTNESTILFCKNNKDHTVSNVTILITTTKYIRDEKKV